VVARFDIPADAVDATFVRAGIEYHDLIGDFDTSVVPGTTFQLHRPVGLGVHVLEIVWLGAASTPQQITVPSQGQVYLNSDAIFVDFQSIEHTDFGASGTPAFLCDGTYTNVLSVVATGTCWGARGSQGGAETRKAPRMRCSSFDSADFGVSDPGCRGRSLDWVRARTGRFVAFRGDRVALANAASFPARYVSCAAIPSPRASRPSGSARSGSRAQPTRGVAPGANVHGVTANRDEQRTSQLLGGHAVLAAGWIGWRILESTPALASAWGGSFASSVPGRALALVTLLAAVLALGVVLLRSAQRWRDPRAALLLVALGAAVPARAGVDVFDLTYVGLVAMLAVAWFDGRWRARRRSPDPIP